MLRRDRSFARTRWDIMSAGRYVTAQSTGKARRSRFFTLDNATVYIQPKQAQDIYFEFVIELFVLDPYIHNDLLLF
jgi:hypothetical protein